MSQIKMIQVMSQIKMILQDNVEMNKEALGGEGGRERKEGREGR